MYHAIGSKGGGTPSFERAIDLAHLAKQTLGDRALEREVLDLFRTQVRVVLARLVESAGSQARHELAHTLKGSARAVGAWKVAHEAEGCEQHVADGEWAKHLHALQQSVAEALGAIERFDRVD